MSSRYHISPQVQARLREMNVTADSVLRQTLDIRAQGFDVDGNHFPEGTIFIAIYKDGVYSCRVKDGAVIVDGDDKRQEHSSLSGAAASITGRPTTNGLDFWGSVKLAGKNEAVSLKSFRKQS